MLSPLILASLLPALLSTPTLALPSPGPPGSALITSSSSSGLPACFQQAYYGTYGGSLASQDHIYLPDDECLYAADALDSLSQGTIVPLPVGGQAAQDGRMVWVGQAGVDPELVMQTMEDAWEVIVRRSAGLAQASSAQADAQRVLSSHQTAAIGLEHTRPIELIHRTAHSLLLQVPSSFLPIIDTLLPAHLVPVALPLSPLPRPRHLSASSDAEAGAAAEAQWETVPAHFVKNLRNITANLKFEPEIDRIVSDGIELNAIRRDVRWLTGEAPSGIESRHSFTEGAVKAANWIKTRVEDTGANCILQPFLHGFAPNVICTYPSSLNSTEHVILSAHYDSRGTFGSTRAPGGDDDGSGSGHLLGVAHAIGTQGVRFEKSVTLAFFAGEEQGLLGSHAYAEYLHSVNTTVLLQVQADMLGYHAPGETLQIGLPESIHLPEATYLIGNLSHLYSPELVVGRTAACCSDHQSFVGFGFPATQVFERNGWIADPKYHDSGDTSQREGYDFEQIVSIAKVTLAALLTVAGYKVKA